MPHFVPFEAIHVADNRQRREFDAAALEELRTSIQESAYGLQNAIVVRRPSGEANPVLVSGERRLRAIGDIYSLGGTFRHAGVAVPAGQVPIVDLGELDPVDAFEAELEENIRRADLTIIERAVATAKLMELRTAQATRDGRAPPVASDIAAEVYDIPATKPKEAYGQATTTISNQLLVARHASDEDVAKATSLKEAVKIIKKKDEAKRNVELAALHGATYNVEKLRVELADSEEYMRGFMAESFDIILTDPPYGMGADQFGDSGTGPAEAGSHFYDDSYEAWCELIEWFAAESFRVAKPNAHLYAFCDIDNFQEFKDTLATAGWNVHRTPLVWYNQDGFRAPWPEHGPQRKYELVLYARKGGKKCTTLRGDVLEYRRDAAAGHPAQKPVNLLIDLLKRSAAPGDIVLDPFAGSGSTLIACHELKLPCVGIERDQAAYGIALKRLQALTSTQETLL